MKVSRFLLTQRGFSVGKVSILVGGPDWPVSVCCGIMRLQLMPIIIGTTPVLLLVIPLALSGAFMIQGPTPPFPSLMQVAAAFSFLTQTFAGITMLYAVEHAAFEHKSEIDSMADDEEVLALERETAAHEMLVEEITRWSSGEVPKPLKLLLMLGATAATAVMLASTMLSSRCFGDFALYPDYRTQVDSTLDGNWLNIVKFPFGWGVIALSLVAIVCHACFAIWARVYVRAQEKRGRKARSPARNPLLRATSRANLELGSFRKAAAPPDAGLAAQQAQPHSVLTSALSALSA